jgi:hypothetical protein
MPTVDGDDWTKKRLRALEAALEGDLTDEQRTAIEAELAQLRSTQRHFLPRWLRLRLPHQH